MRTLKFVKYFSSFGWESIVLTVKKPIVQYYDTTLLKEIPFAVRVIRTLSLEFDWNKVIFGRKHYKDNPLLCSKKIIKPSFIGKIVKRLKWWFSFPDSRTGWIPFCIFSGYKLIKKEKIDVIYVSAEPFSAFISGVLLKKLTGKPLVLDFRDEWVGFSKYYFPEKPMLLLKIEKILEAWFIKNADKVISVTDSIIAQFRERYPKEDKDKFSCVTNGFDPSDFNVKVENKENTYNNLFTIVYAGSLYGARNPMSFLEAINRCIAIKPDFLRKIKIKFIGEMPPDIFDIINRLPSMNSIIEMTGFVCHEAALQQMAKSEALLYIEDESLVSSRILPAKIFEYMALRVPIIALAGKGEVKKVIEETGTGVVFSHQDIDSISDYLFSCLDYFEKKQPHLVVKINDSIDRFSRIKTALQLTQIFSQLSNHDK
ncbi:MAG: glycosyltransferase [Candidatus Omnitrophica bacterium]|nr:glycosyltransferase [Candidatus Omnitrophota bacterium]